MFGFRGTIGGRDFLIGIVVSVVGAIALATGLFLLSSLIPCAVDTCGAVGFLGFVLVLSVLAPALSIVIASFSVRRARDAGLPPSLGLIVPLFIGTALISRFYFPVPVLLFGFSLMAFSSVVVFCFLPTSVRRESRRKFALPSRWAVLAAAVLTIVAFYFGIPSDAFWPLAFILWLIPVGIPTFLAYLLLFWTLVGAATRPSTLALSLLVVAFIPFALWANGFRTHAHAQRAEKDEIASIATVSPTERPATFLIEEDRSHYDVANAVESLPFVTRIIERDAAGRVSDVWLRDQVGHFSQAKDSEARLLPGRFFLLKIGLASDFPKGNARRQTISLPMELRLVLPGHDDLLAVTYRTVDTPPSIPPLLTLWGWKRQNVSQREADRQAAAEQFLSAAIR